MKPRVRIAIVLGSAAAGMFSAAALWRVFPGLAYLDLQVAPIATTARTDKIVLVTVRHETFEKLDLDAVGATIPRSQHARLLRLLQRAYARVVVFDTLFSERTRDDGPLREALATPSKTSVVLLVEALRKGMRGNDETRFSVARPAVLPFLRPANVVLGQAQTWEPDNVVRGIKLFVEDRDLPGTLYPHLAAQAAVVGKDDAVSERKGTLSGGGHAWPHGTANELRLRWGRPVPDFEFADAVRRLEAGDDGAFRGATVVVGAANQGQRADDMHSTPLGDMSGGQVIASAIRTLSEPDVRQIRPAPLWVEAVAAALVAVAAASLTVRPGFVKAMAAVGLAAFAGLGLSVVALRVSNLALPVLGIASAGLVSAMVSGVVGGQRLLPSWVRFRWSLDTQEVAALFIDVEDSTVLLGLLQTGQRDFLEAVQRSIAQVVDANRGHVERTMGDGAFAVFRTGGAEARARHCIEAMRALIERFVDEAPLFRERFGVVPVLVLGAEMATVEAAILSSRGREEFTTLGRDIAYAQRVQAAAKGMASRCAIGPRMGQVAESFAHAVTVHAVALKGYEGLQPVTEIEAATQSRD